MQSFHHLIVICILIHHILDSWGFIHSYFPNARNLCKGRIKKFVLQSNELQSTALFHCDVTYGWNETFYRGDFLRYYWQQRPLLIRNAISLNAMETIPDEAWITLATDEDVESRIVIAKEKKFSLQNGPFAKEELENIPLSNWTILLQELDRHLPQVADLWEQYFNFIPTWRRDDIMVSYSMPGGGIGAHVDNYDVFLLQGRGQREWSIEDTFLTDREEQAREVRKSDVRLLKNFRPSKTWVLNPGDMLYLPPRIPHRGATVGADPSTTFSFGFRAINYANSIFHYWMKASKNCFRDVAGEAFYHDDPIQLVEMNQFLGTHQNSLLTDCIGSVGSIFRTKISSEMMDKFTHTFQPKFEDQFIAWLGQELTTPTRLHRRNPKPFFLASNSLRTKPIHDEGDEEDYVDDDEDDLFDDLVHTEPIYLRDQRYRVATRRLFNSAEEVFQSLLQDEITLRRCEGVKAVFIYPTLFFNGKRILLEEYFPNQKELIAEIGIVFTASRWLSVPRLVSIYGTLSPKNRESFHRFFQDLIEFGYFYPVDKS